MQQRGRNGRYPDKVGTKENLADSIAMGVNPATVCSDLLKPGGYGRLAPMLTALAATVRDEGCSDLPTWKAQRQAAATAAGNETSCAAHVAHVRGDGVGDYHVDGNSKLPREVDHDLEMFGCVACNFCVTVCPNDAFTSIKSLAGDDQGMDARQQYLVFVELCNECGNCMTFCPERGDPAEIKPKLYTDPDLFHGRDGQGFLVDDVGRVVAARADADAVDLVQQLLDTQTGNPLRT